MVNKLEEDKAQPMNLKPNINVLTCSGFLKGTHIRTLHGEVPVESIYAGTKVLTYIDQISTVKWLGSCKVDKNLVAEKDALRVFPVLIKKDAIAEYVPRIDLVVAPGHLLQFNDKLIPAMALVNGQTIVQKFECKLFEYFQVELERLDILMAEGVPTESYADMGDRSMFKNVGQMMIPDDGCAETALHNTSIAIARNGRAVEEVREQLLKRAESMGRLSRSTDAALCIEVNGQIVHPTPKFVKEGVYHFKLPACFGDIHILSRSAIVREVTALARRDVRQIGVGLSGIAVITDEGRYEVDLQNPDISGLNTVQVARGQVMRWTTGNAVIPNHLINKCVAATLELTVLRTYTYWVGSNEPVSI